MRGVYKASFGGVSVTAIQDLFEINAPATRTIEILSWWIGQSSDFGDAQAEVLRLQVSRATTSGSVGTTVTARPSEPGEAAFSGTVEANNTTQAGTTTVMEEYTFNVAVGFAWIYSPEERPVIAPSGRIVLELPVAPVDALTMSGTVAFRITG
ncbi:MAG TPA: hypothetical protein VM487_17490 [Phycisphaerae bacterium]|nr:hypothetical protein [Phycisphaerae bacterium]